MPPAPTRVALAAAILMAAAPAAAESERVAFPGDGFAMEGVLFRPAGPGPHPAVVALHGCGGLRGAGGALDARFQDWGERLAAAGFVVLLPDSFGPRGAGPQCRTQDRVARPSRERVADAVAARAYLQGRADVRPEAVSLLGWSNGATTVLYAVRPGREAGDGRPDFARAVALYPGCRAPHESGRWRTRLPLLLLVGEADDWTASEGAGRPRRDRALSGRRARLRRARLPAPRPARPRLHGERVGDGAGGNGPCRAGGRPAAGAGVPRALGSFRCRGRRGRSGHRPGCRAGSPRRGGRP